MGTVLEDALKNMAYHLAKNIEDLTPGQIAQVEADPLTYLPEGYTPEETPEEEVAEAGEVVSEEVAETLERASEEVAETPVEEVSEPPAEAVVRKTRKRG